MWYQEKKALVEEQLRHRSDANTARTRCFSPHFGSDVRNARPELRRQKRASEEEYLARARANKQAADASMQQARKNHEAMLKAKTEEGLKEKKETDALVVQERRRIRQERRRAVNAVYSERFASAAEAKRMLGDKANAPAEEEAEAEEEGEEEEEEEAEAKEGEEGEEGEEGDEEGGGGGEEVVGALAGEDSLAVAKAEAPSTAEVQVS